MNESAASNAPSAEDVSRLLHTIAQLLRHTHRLGPATQALLADLVDELGTALAHPDVSSAEIARLVECASHLVRVVHEEKKAGMLAAAREQLEHAAVAIEMRVPGVAVLARRFAEMLSDVGI